MHIQIPIGLQLYMIIFYIIKKVEKELGILNSLLIHKST